VDAAVARPPMLAVSQTFVGWNAAARLLDGRAIPDPFPSWLMEADYGVPVRIKDAPRHRKPVQFVYQIRVVPG
jgi:hypothetical protein